jgi:hypothetical protein
MRDLTGSGRGSRSHDFELNRTQDVKETEEYISALKSGDASGGQGKFTKQPLDSPEAIAKELAAAEKELGAIHGRKKNQGFGGGMREEILKIVKQSVRESDA